MPAVDRFMVGPERCSIQPLTRAYRIAPVKAALRSSG